MKSSLLESQEDIFKNSFLPWQKQTEKENTRDREIRCRDYPGRYIAKISATEGRFKPRWSRSRSPGHPGGCLARPGGVAAPGGLLGPLELLPGSTRAWNFPNFAKL